MKFQRKFYICAIEIKPGNIIYIEGNRIDPSLNVEKIEAKVHLKIKNGALSSIFYLELNEDLFVRSVPIKFDEVFELASIDDQTSLWVDAENIEKGDILYDQEYEITSILKIEDKCFFKYKDGILIAQNGKKVKIKFG